MADWAGLAGAVRGAGPALENHLWQSTVFAGVAAGLALALKKNQARARYWIWMSASVKLLLPFALLAGVVGHFARPKALPALHTGVVAAVVDVSEPFQGQVRGSRFEVRGTAGAPNFVDPTRDGETVTNGAPNAVASSHVSEARHGAPGLVASMVGWLRAWALVVLGGVWLVGFVTVLVTWGVRWRRVAQAMRAAEVVGEGREVGTLRRVEAAAGVRSEIEIRLVTPRQTDGLTWGTQMEPGVFGIVRPVLAWPERISGLLDDAHLEAVLAHEVCHVRRRDNFTAALHMVVQAVFWFHPMVWWVGARLVEERERACDEEVLELFGRPEAYAESILKVCEFCVSSPLECVAGVTGADLKKRVVEIMTGRVVRKLTWGKKLLLVGVGLAVAAVPIVLGQAKAARRMMEAAIAAAPGPLKGPVWVVFGMAGTREMIAEESTPYTALIAEVQDPTRDGGTVTNGAPTADGMELGPEFEVATIRPANRDDGRRWFGTRVDDSGRFMASGVSLDGLVSRAYGRVDLDREAPKWVNSEDFDINAKVDEAYMAGWDKMSDAQRIALVRPMVRRLLADRFKLKLRTEMRDTPVYVLVQSKGGAKMKEVPSPPPPEGRLTSILHINCPGKEKEMTCMGKAVPVSQLIGLFAGFGNLQIGRTVIDETGLKGYYDYSFTVSTGADADAPIKQIEDQLGLRFEPREVPRKVYVIESAERPSVDGAEVAHPVSLVLVGQASGGASSQVSEARPRAPDSGASGGGAVGVKISAEEAAIAESIEFDVASFKVNTMNQPHATFEMPQDGDGFTILNRPMRDLIRFAYNVTSGANYHFSNEPAWINDVKWDIRAKVAPEDIAKWQKLSNAARTLTLRRFCEEQLKLKFHADTTPYTFYTLVVDKKGAKMAEAQPGDTVQAPSGLVIPAGGVLWTRPGEIVAHSGTMTQLATVLSGHSPYVVHDETGLTGVYNFAISYSAAAMDDPRARALGVPPGYMAAQDDGPTLYNAIAGLGLKLVATKGTLEGMVVDHVELPPKD